MVSILLVAAPPASAQTIERRIIVRGDPFTLPAGQICVFALRVRIVGQYKTVDYFDADGDLVRSRDTQLGHSVSTTGSERAASAPGS